MLEVEQILNDYYENNARKLRRVVDGILLHFGGLSNKDYDDFYSLANEVFVDAMNRYDSSQPFDGFLYSCLSNKIKTEVTKKNRYKRMADRMSVSLDEPVNKEDTTTVGELLMSNFDLERESCFSEEVVKAYLMGLSEVQRQLIEMKMDGISVIEIKKKLGMTARQYEQCCKACKVFAKKTGIL